MSRGGHGHGGQCTEKLMKFEHVAFLKYASAQTNIAYNRDRDTLITILNLTPTRDGEWD